MNAAKVLQQNKKTQKNNKQKTLTKSVVQTNEYANRQFYPKSEQNNKIECINAYRLIFVWLFTSNDTQNWSMLCVWTLFSLVVKKQQQQQKLNLLFASDFVYLSVCVCVRSVSGAKQSLFMIITWSRKVQSRHRHFIFHATSENLEHIIWVCDCVCVFTKLIK